MALIISDTTTPIILAKTNHLDLLSNFVDVVYIPPAVKEELSQKNDGVKEAIEQAKFIEVRELNNPLTAKLELVLFWTKDITIYQVH